MRVTIGAVGLLAVGFGCSGGNSAPIVCSPGSSTGQLDTRSAGIAAVAADETHIAFLRDPVTTEAGCLARGASVTTGTLVAASIQPDGSICERTVASNVSQRDVAFSDDSRHLVFRDVDDCGRGTLQIADADGGNVRLVARKVYTHKVKGAAVVYDADGDGTDFAAPIGGGAPVSMWTQNQGYGPDQGVNATGTAFAHKTDGTEGYGVEPGSLVVVPLASGRPRVVVDATKEGAGWNFHWSPRGEWLAFPHYPFGNIDMLSLALVPADGTSRTEVSAACQCRVIAFAPDDSWVAYDEADSSGGVRLMTHSLKDGSNVALGVMPASDYPQVQFSDDGANVIALVADPNTSLRSMYGATVGVAGSLKQLATDLAFGGDGTVGAAGGHAAFSLYPDKVEVVPLSGGAPVTFAGSYPYFEPGVADPHLVFSAMYDPATLGFARGDGTGATFQTLSGESGFFQWLGSTVIDATGPSDHSLTFTAFSNDGTVSTELARSVSAYAWAPIPAPTRLLYSRAAAGADGPAGLWTVDLPR